MTLIEGAVAMLDKPWQRVRSPVPIPELDADLRSWNEDSFADLLRSNLLPRDVTPEGRRRHDAFWGKLRRDPDLTEWAMDVLEDMGAATDDALNDGSLDAAEAKRAQKFAGQCEDALNRLDRPQRTHLDWAGNAGNFQPAARRVIATLVEAIDQHRDSTEQPTAADRRLWATLRRVNLDPRDYRSE